MGMTPTDFYHAFVFANYLDCIENPGCVRRAFNAAVSASHLADHYWTYWEKNDPSKIKDLKTWNVFVRDLSTNTGDCFKDIRSIANAYKHLYESTDPRKSAHSTIASTGDIESISFKDKNLEVNYIEEKLTVKSEDEASRYRVIYTRKDGHRKDFLSSLKKVIDYWQKKYY